MICRFSSLVERLKPRHIHHHPHLPISTPVTSLVLGKLLAPQWSGYDVGHPSAVPLAPQLKLKLPGATLKRPSNCTVTKVIHQEPEKNTTAFLSVSDCAKLQAHELHLQSQGMIEPTACAGSTASCQCS